MNCNDCKLFLNHCTISLLKGCFTFFLSLICLDHSIQIKHISIIILSKYSFEIRLIKHLINLIKICKNIHSFCKNLCFIHVHIVYSIKFMCDVHKQSVCVFTVCDTLDLAWNSESEKIPAYGWLRRAARRGEELFCLLHQPDLFLKTTDWAKSLLMLCKMGATDCSFCVCEKGRYPAIWQHHLLTVHSGPLWYQPYFSLISWISAKVTLALIDNECFQGCHVGLWALWDDITLGPIDTTPRATQPWK